MNVYLFAYGSLMNPKSLSHTLPGERLSGPATLRGYARKMNAPFSGYAYLNIVPRDKSEVRGVLIALAKEELALFTSREEGYALTNVTDMVVGATDGTVYSFIAPDIECDLKVPRSYIDTCTAGMSDGEKKTWLRETIIGDIEEDTVNPVYEFPA